MISLNAPVTLDRYIAAVHTILGLRSRPVRLDGDSYVSLEHIKLCLTDRNVRSYRDGDSLIVPQYRTRLRQDMQGLEASGI